MRASFRRADPGEFGPVEFGFCAPGKLSVVERAADSAERQTIGLGQVIDVIGRNHRARARHILDDEVRISRNVLSHVARVGASPEVMHVARKITHYKSDRLSLIKRSLRENRIKRHRNEETNG